MSRRSFENQATSSGTFPLQDVHVWMRHAKGEHQELLEKADQLLDNDPELIEIERALAETPDTQWNLTPRGMIEATPFVQRLITRAPLWQSPLGCL